MSRFFALSLQFTLLFAQLLLPSTLWGAFSNYNSVLIGDRAAGMAGAYTALTGDPAGVSFYNPAAISRMRGTSLSASASVYHKYDSQFGDGSDTFESAVLRVNRGAFKAIPSASGGVISFRRFAIGVSVIVPDHEFYAGKVKAENNTISYMNLVDSSLWAGGNFAYNLSKQHSIGFTAYYTSRDYLRTVTDQSIVANTSGQILNEEKAFTNNSLIYILGYFYQLNPRWSFGISARFPSIEIDGQGSYFRTLLQAESGTISTSTINETNIKSETRIPSKLSLGMAFTRPKLLIVSADIQYYGQEEYDDIDLLTGADHIVNHSVINTAIGVEWIYHPSLRLRFGAFTNFSSHPPIALDVQQRQGDHIDMWGVSANAAFYSSESASFTFGGYYSGGSGTTTQLFNQQVTIVPKDYQVFAMLISSAYYF